MHQSKKYNGNSISDTLDRFSATSHTSRRLGRIVKKIRRSREKSPSTIVAENNFTLNLSTVFLTNQHYGIILVHEKFDI